MGYDILSDEEGLSGKTIATKLETAEGREADVRIVVAKEAVLGSELEYKLTGDILVPLGSETILMIFNPLVLICDTRGGIVLTA